MGDGPVHFFLVSHQFQGSEKSRASTVIPARHTQRSTGPWLDDGEVCVFGELLKKNCSGVWWTWRGWCRRGGIGEPTSKKNGRQSYKQPPPLRGSDGPRGTVGESCMPPRDCSRTPRREWWCTPLGPAAGKPRESSFGGNRLERISECLYRL